MISEYLAQQLSGPVSQSVIDSAKSEFDKTQIELDYMLAADIDEASGDFLYFLGQWAGLPWPLAPEGTFDDNRFTLGAVIDYPESGINGFSIGFLGSVAITDLVFYPIAVYRSMLKAYCKLKTNGVSVRSVEELVTSLWPDYTISYNADKDLLFTFLPNISGAYLYALRAVTPSLCVSPQIVYEQG